MKISILEKFATDLKAKFDLPGHASDEDQLKPVVAEMFNAVGEELGHKVESRTETHLSEHKVRPDIAIYVDGLICGYIELKAPGLGADAPKLKGPHNKQQWEKLKGLPNLIYTDGREWALYRNGERQGPIIRFDDDPSTAGDKAITQSCADELGSLLSDYLIWNPIVPHRPTELAKYLAPMTRFLRGEVEAALATPGSSIDLLASEWRRYFFPDADDAQFADAYAQTVTYAMLLARLSGAEKLDPAEAAKTLDKGNRLLARALELLGQPDAKKELRVGFELLQRSLEALDPHDFMKSKPDLWLYFYEDFLAAYDPKLRRDYGVYYTPREVVELQIRFASELLEKRFGKKLGFADDGVVFLDPAVGTGTYPVAAVKHALEKVRERFGEGAVAARAAQMAKNMYGFEVLVGPYAVAHLRLTQALESVGAEIDERLKIYLADTLESPNAAPPGGLTLTYKTLSEEHESAREVKNGGDILVCLGNPPYDRQQIDEGDTTTQRKGGWVRFGDQIEGGAKQEAQGQRPIFADFTEPASKAGQGVHIKNLYNDYVYFWRWALWRLFEQQTCGGIVTFITASSYLAGPGFIGMREMMRRTFDEIWILDLGGDNLGTRKTPNVFAIQTPVAIAIGVRGENPSPDTPAIVHYTKIAAETRDLKLAKIEACLDLAAPDWKGCPVDWLAPFLPAGKGDYFEWPRVTELFPFQRSGSKFGRSWPIAETKELLSTRWKMLVSETGAIRQKRFKNNQYRKIENKYQSHITGNLLSPLSEQTANAECPKITAYAFRSFDRQWAIEDIRFNDRMGEYLWQIQGANQLYFTCLASESLAVGLAMMASTNVPDLHHFCGRGGKDIIPLYRDAEATYPNITKGLIDILGAAYAKQPTAEDLAAYVYAALGGQSYTSRFWNELETPGPRVPLTKDSKIFAEAVKLGERLIWLHTYAERFRGDDRGDQVPAGTAKNTKAISSTKKKYPEKFEYDPEAKEIRVGDGLFGPVAPEIWAFEVSGLKVVQSWLGYRMKVRAGKKSSPLDDIRPESWTPAMTGEFLELLWVLEATLDMEPLLSAVLDKIVAGPCFKASELPTPTEAERKPPGSKKTGGFLHLLEDDEAEDDDEVDEN